MQENEAGLPDDYTIKYFFPLASFFLLQAMLAFYGLKTMHLLRRFILVKVRLRFAVF